MGENKKAAVPVPSVGADGEQSHGSKTTDIITQNASESNEEAVRSYEEMLDMMERMNDPAYLHTVSMIELYQTAYQSRPPIIDGLLYVGAYILAGAPKIGKSFLVAQIAYHVSAGTKLWGFDVRQGTVLYLALEDDYQRIQGRMFQMYGENDTPNLFFATDALKVGRGLDEQLDKFVKEHANTKLIIVDTLQKVREIAGDAYSYSSDYDLIGKLKQFADPASPVSKRNGCNGRDDVFDTVKMTVAIVATVAGKITGGFMTEKRNIGIYFKVSEKEQEIIHRKMEILGTQNQSAYIRKMVIDGYAVHLDWKSLTELLSLLRRTSANVNQIAQRCNATGHLYEADLMDLKNGYAGLLEQTKTIVNDIAKLKVL